MKTLIAKILYWLNFKPCFSTNICDELTAGYGKLDFNGFWQYQLPYDHQIYRKIK